MWLILTSFLFVLAASVFYFVRKAPVTVNCWFCNQDSKILRKFVNSWTCKHCDQYNGFTDTGDYNREIPEQYDETLNPWVPKKNSEIPPQPDLTSLDPPNGLCETCNLNQTLKTRQLATFVPTSEDRFDEEVEIYRARLERAYALCKNCQKFVSNELTYQRSKIFGTLDKTGYWKKKSPKPKLSPEQSNRHKNRRRKYRHPGPWSRRFHVLNFVIAFSLFFSDFLLLEQNSDVQVTRLPEALPLAASNLLRMINRRSEWLALGGLLTHIVSMSVGQARLTFMDLVAGICWTLLTILHCGYITAFIVGGAYTLADLMVWRTGLTCIATMVSSFVTLLPRKRLRTKQNKFKTCLSLSIASTPNSQCSTNTQSTSRKSVLPNELTELDPDFVRPSMRPPNEIEIENVEPMENGDASESLKTSNSFHFRPRTVPRPQKSQELSFSMNLRNRSPKAPEQRTRDGMCSEDVHMREETPSRELGRGLGAMTLGLNEDVSAKVPQRRGPFSSMSFPAAAAGTQSEATSSIFSSIASSSSMHNSILAPPKFQIPRNDRFGSHSTHLSATSCASFSQPQNHGYAERRDIFSLNSDRVFSEAGDSGLTSVSRRRPPFSNCRTTDDISVSGTCSVSQLTQEQSKSNLWLKICFGIIAVGSVVTNVLVLYHLVLRK